MPAVNPVTRAVVEPVDDTETLAVLVHVPPTVKLLTDIDEPIHTALGPPILDGFAYTVITIVADIPDTV